MAVCAAASSAGLSVRTFASVRPPFGGRTMADDRQLRRPSEHFEAFRLRVDRLRGRGLDSDAVLDLAEDLGGQISVIRHNQVNMSTKDELRDLRLFGDKDLGIPGAFDQINGSLQDLTATVNRRAESAARVVREDKRAHERLVDTWWGRISIGTAIFFGLAMLVLTIYTAVK